MLAKFSQDMSPRDAHTKTYIVFHLHNSSVPSCPSLPFLHTSPQHYNFAPPPTPLINSSTPTSLVIKIAVSLKLGTLNLAFTR